MPFQRDYFAQLATEGQIENVPEIYTNIFAEGIRRMANYPDIFRDDKYRIIDEMNFERIW